MPVRPEEAANGLLHRLIGHKLEGDAGIKELADIAKLSRGDVQGGVQQSNCFRKVGDWLIRAYEHAKDFEEIVQLCRNVYGGTDYLPHNLEGFAKDPHMRVLVLQSQAGPLHGIGVLVLESRELGWIMGLRIHEDQRGHGLGRLLLAALTAEAALEGASVAMSATLPSNAPMMHIFRSLDYRIVRPILTWPHWEMLRQIQAEDQTDDVKSQRLILEAAGVPSDALTPHVRHLSGMWRVCKDVDELEEVVRATRRGAVSGQLHGVENAPKGALYRFQEKDFHVTWLPQMYAAWPVQGHRVAQALEAGDVWFLDQQPQNGMIQRAERGVILKAPGELPGQIAIGVLASSLEVVWAGLLKCQVLAHRFYAFMDVCDEDELTRAKHGLQGQQNELFPGLQGRLVDGCILAFPFQQRIKEGEMYGR